MPLLAIFAPLLDWIFNVVVIKFVLFSGLFAVLTYFVPLLIGYISPFIGVPSLTSAFSGLDAGVWFWLDFFQLGYGVPLLISAHVTRFLIRRIPFIG